MGIRSNRMTSATFLVLVLTVALFIKMIPSAKAATVHTAVTFIEVSTDPVAIGDNVEIQCGIWPNPPSGNFYSGILFSLVGPDESEIILGPLMSDASGEVSSPFVPTQIGTYSVTVSYPGEVWGENNYTSFYAGTIYFEVVENLPPESTLFEISAYPSSQSVSQGESTNYNVTLIFADEPNLGCSLNFPNLPLDVSYRYLGPYPLDSISGYFAIIYMIRITAGDETPLGQNIITIKALSEEMSNSTTVTLNVEPRSESSTSSSIRAICLNTHFINETSKKMDVWIEGTGEKRISKVNITDQNNELIFSTTNNEGDYLVSTPYLNIEKEKLYDITTVSVSNETLVYRIYSTDHILTCFPSNCWPGNEYINDYKFQVNIIEEAYNELISLTRNGKNIETGGVTINNLPWAAGYATPGIVYLGVYNSVVLSNISNSYGLDITFHELAHAVLLETPGSDLVTQEGIACFFEAELFRLLGYGEEYKMKTSHVLQSNFKNAVGEKYSSIALQYANSETHTYPGAWVVACLLQDFVGYGQFKNEFDSDFNTDLVSDQGWNFLQNYYYVASEIEAPIEYNDHEKLLYYFELASGLSLKQDFLDWGFNISNIYETGSVIPEFPLWPPLLIMLVAVVAVIVIYRRKLRN